MQLLRIQTGEVSRDNNGANYRVGIVFDQSGLEIDLQFRWTKGNSISEKYLSNMRVLWSWSHSYEWRDLEKCVYDLVDSQWRLEELPDYQQLKAEGGDWVRSKSGI